MAKTETGYFLIADISGYTQYLSESELEHAHEVLQTLLELLIDHTRPPLIISRLAGDAVISYGLEADFLTGQSFIELIENTYVAFRRTIEQMVLNTTCKCNACANIGTLDLKFFVHHGAFTRQRLDHHDELLGSDVNLLHRLLKNSVAAETGIRAYALYTNAAVERLGIEDVRASMTEHEEAYEHLGQVRTWIQDMHPVWEQKKKNLRIEIPEDEVLFRREKVYPVPLEQMWDLVTRPEYRAKLVNADTQDIVNRQNGRVGLGSEFHCYHSDGRVTVQTIVDWHPFEQMVTEDSMPIPGVTALIHLGLEPAGDETRLIMTISKGRGPKLKSLILNLVAGRIVPPIFERGLADLHDLILQDQAASLEPDR